MVFVHSALLRSIQKFLQTIFTPKLASSSILQCIQDQHASTYDPTLTSQDNLLSCEIIIQPIICLLPMGSKPLTSFVGKVFMSCYQRSGPLSRLHWLLYLLMHQNLIGPLPKQESSILNAMVTLTYSSRKRNLLFYSKSLENKFIADSLIHVEN